jgi:uncharacterized protein (DUF2235 family)
MKRIALFLDGTWNEPGDNTNVWRLKVMLAAADPSGISQIGYYDEGVGTHWYDRLCGGAIGSGLSLNVRQAYQWLVERYDDEDEVFIFGFSRGAYTARSVAGMIMKCGLLYPGAAMTGMEIFIRYQIGKEARPIYELKHIVDSKLGKLTTDEQRLLMNSRRIPIKMIGVWDTVGALGIPWTQAPLIGRGKFYFLNTNFSKLYEHAYQAVAIDENREPYRPTLWTKFTPAIPDPTPSGPPSVQQVEQRWFTGAHCNVGGGYAGDELAQIPLVWLQEKAIQCGLSFRHVIALRGNEVLCEPRDSYKEFLRGVYRVATFGRRYYRVIGAPSSQVKGGTSRPINEWIDGSVFERWKRVQTYRPPNLTDWARRNSLDPGTISGPRYA